MEKKNPVLYIHLKISHFICIIIIDSCKQNIKMQMDIFEKKKKKETARNIDHDMQYIDDVRRQSMYIFGDPCRVF